MTLKLSQPWAYTPEEFAEGLFFHGSIEPWRNNLPHAGGYDGAFWTADKPLIAQTYIPQWGGSTLISFPRHRPDDHIAPNKDILWDLAKKHLGASAEVLSWDFRGYAQSWRSGKSVTFGQLQEELERLGYTFKQPENSAWIKTDHQDGNRAIPNDAKPYGRLLIVEPMDDLKLMDISSGEGDLTDLQYHQVDNIKKAFKLGTDVFKIDDFCQSPNWGNVGHSSWGFSPKCIQEHFAQGRVVTIAATHRDWPNTMSPADLMTQDLMDWHFGQVLHAMAMDKPVPSSVLQAHQVRFEAFFDAQPQSSVSFPVTIDPLGALSIEQPYFAMNASGQVVSRYIEPAALLEAARREGKVIPVQAVFLDADNHPMSVQYLLDQHEALINSDSDYQNMASAPRMSA